LGKGIFLVLEGIDGTGKSTQAKLLHEAVLQKGHPVMLTREPGGTPLGESIRDILLTSDLSMNTWAEILLYSAARGQLVGEVIRPSLQKGNIVICDRYILSSLAYQGYGRGGDPELILEINQRVTEGLWPHMIFILDLEVEKSRQRLEVGNPKASKDRLERMDIDFYRKVRQGYLDFARRYPSITRVIPSDQPLEKVHKQILGYLEDLL